MFSDVIVQREKDSRCHIQAHMDLSLSFSDGQLWFPPDKRDGNFVAVADFKSLNLLDAHFHRSIQAATHQWIDH